MRLASATAVSSVWPAKKTSPTSMMAKKQAKKGMATIPNSTAALPFSLRSKRLAIGRKRRPILERSVAMKPRDRLPSAGKMRMFYRRQLDDQLQRRPRPDGPRLGLVNHVARDGRDLFRARSGRLAGAGPGPADGGVDLGLPIS